MNLVAGHMQMETESPATGGIKTNVSHSRQKWLAKLRISCMIHMGLATLQVMAGIAILAVASKNIAFPTFNFGPIIVGVLCFLGGVTGWHCTCIGLQEDARNEPSAAMKSYFLAYLVLAMCCIPLAILSTGVCVMTTIICSDPAGTSIELAGEVLNETASCEPYTTASAAINAIAGVVCVSMVLFLFVGSCFGCHFGRVIGFIGHSRTAIDSTLSF